MLKIRLQPRGKKNYRTYRVVVADQHAPIKGKFVADLGHYNPHTSQFSVQKDAVAKWLKTGALASPTVHNLLVTHKLIDAPKVTAWRPKKKAQDESRQAQAAPAAAAPAAETKPN